MGERGLIELLKSLFYELFSCSMVFKYNLGAKIEMIDYQGVHGTQEGHNPLLVQRLQVCLLRPVLKNQTMKCQMLHSVLFFGEF